MTVAGSGQVTADDAPLPAGPDGERLAFDLIAVINEHLSELLAFSERLVLVGQSLVGDLEQLIGDHAVRVLQLVQGRTTP
ncbi:MAG: hypothetical protein QOE23_2345 [Pseudonocardiales bacterium]|nr:hypothetical protein [Pseudonocardiales bacterium]